MTSKPPIPYEKAIGAFNDGERLSPTQHMDREIDHIERILDRIDTRLWRGGRQ